MNNTLSDDDNPNLNFSMKKFRTTTTSDSIVPFDEQIKRRKEMKVLFDYKTSPLSDYGFRGIRRIDPNKTRWKWSQGNICIRMGDYRLFFDFRQLEKKLKHSTYLNLPTFKKGETKTDKDVFEFLAMILNYFSPSNRLLLNVTFGNRYVSGGQNRGIALLGYDNNRCPLIFYFKQVDELTHEFVTCYSITVPQMQRLAKSSRLQKPENE